MDTMQLISIEATPTTVSFSPAQEYIKPDDMNILHTRSADGTLYSYKIYLKKRWEVPLTQFSKSNADQINSWWEDMQDLYFYPDLVNTPSVYYTARITNTEKPLSAFTEYQWEYLYEGNITLQEV